MSGFHAASGHKTSAYICFTIKRVKKTWIVSASADHVLSAAAPCMFFPMFSSFPLVALDFAEVPHTAATGWFWFWMRRTVRALLSFRKASQLVLPVSRLPFCISQTFGFGTTPFNRPEHSRPHAPTNFSRDAEWNCRGYVLGRLARFDLPLHCSSLNCEQRHQEKLVGPASCTSVKTRSRWFFFQ